MLVIVAYLLPLLVGLGVTNKTDDWELGYFAAVGLKVRLCHMFYCMPQRLS